MGIFVALSDYFLLKESQKWIARSMIMCFLRLLMHNANLTYKIVLLQEKGAEMKTRFRGNDDQCGAAELAGVVVLDTGQDTGGWRLLGTAGPWGRCGAAHSRRTLLSPFLWQP